MPVWARRCIFMAALFVAPAAAFGECEWEVQVVNRETREVKRYSPEWSEQTEIPLPALSNVACGVSEGVRTVTGGIEGVRRCLVCKGTEINFLSCAVHFPRFKWFDSDADIEVWQGDGSPVRDGYTVRLGCRTN